MRQTIFSFRYRQLFFCLALIAHVLFSAGAGELSADIRNPRLVVTLPSAPAGAKFNGGAEFKLSSTWEGDTPPYAATFRTGSGDIGTSNVQNSPAEFSVFGSALGPGAKSFSVSIIETSVPNASPGTANGDKQAEIDTAPLDISVVIDSASKVVGKGGTVRFTVTALNAKSFGEVPRATITPGGAAATPVTPSIPGSVVNYTYTVPTDATGGNYTVQVSAKDNTYPQANANTGLGQDVFGVQTAGPVPPSITSSNVTSPTRAENISFSGSCSNETVSVEVLDKGVSMTPALVVTPSGTTWQATVVSVSEGKHRFTVKGKDRFGNESVLSSEFAMNVDRTKPNKPVLTLPTTPTSIKNITISGKSATDVPTGTDALISTPVQVHLYRIGETATAVASINADGSGNFSFTNVELTEGQNIFYASAEDNARGSPGNFSDQSSTITVLYDVSPAQATALRISSATLASTSLPFSDFLSPGTYNMQVTFGESMDTTVNPTISFIAAGGGNQSANSGTWTASTTFVGQLLIPAGQGATFDGRAQEIKVSGAKDQAGNTMTEYIQNSPSPFGIDTTAPTTKMDSMDTIYIGSGTTSINVRGTASDSTSGVGFVELWWEPFNNPTGTYATQSIGLAPGQNSWVTILDAAALGTGDGAYKLWAYSGDRARPNANIEARLPTGYRLMIVDRNIPQIDRISFDDEAVDIQPTGGLIPTVGSDVSKLSAFINKGNGSATLVLTVPPMIFTLKNPSGTAVSGNYSPLGSSAIMMTFPKLTVNGTYTIEVQPIDTAGNRGAIATRTFVLDLSAPDLVRFDPASGTIVNDSYPPIAADEVWAFVDNLDADYQKSIIEVMYNGLVVGNQKVATNSLVWDLYGSIASHPTDQSGDGRYDVTVTPKDLYGNTGSIKRSFFHFDSQAPVIAQSMPASSTWFGLDSGRPYVKLSDAPSEITRVNGAPVAGDSAWQNSKGSGVAIGSSTFQISGTDVTVGSTVASGTDSLVITSMSGPVYDEENPGPGAASVACDVVSADRVRLNQPNVATATMVAFYDYWRPQASFTRPIDGEKYCKTRINLQTEARDRGNSSDLQITRFEFKTDISSWVSIVTDPVLPADSASSSFWVDITSVAEGDFGLAVRSFDRAGNHSDPDNEVASPAKATEISITIDRTPPVAPTLVLPLNDTVTRARGHRFKWSTVADAQMYLVQIADDSAFNNILNNTGQILPATYGAIIGELTPMAESAFSAPKDGTYYWRVAALELCQDGYNISKWSTTWRVVVDTVKPKVLEVQPTPSTGNKVSTGLVTFTLRFSEKMDVTVLPTVALTSAGGEMMLIEQQSFRENTWIGTTVIPKNNSATYDGNAVIAISGAKDLAGNEMETDSTNQIIINTGPAFETKIFSNPAHEWEIMIVTRSTEALQAPPTCAVTQSGNRVPVTMNFLKEKYYAGSYRINPDQSGKAYIDVNGTDLFGMIGRGSVEFVVANLNPSVRALLTTPDNQASLDVAAGTVSKNTQLYILPRSAVEAGTSVSMNKALKANKAYGGSTSGNNTELVEIQSLEEIGPNKISLLKPIKFTASIKTDFGVHDQKKVGLYRNDGERWKYCGPVSGNGTLSASLNGTGRLAIMADVKPPVVVNLNYGDRAKLDDPCPVLEGTLADYGCGLATGSFKLLIDGRQEKNATLGVDGQFRYQVRQPLAKGKHQIELSAEDLAGNVIRQAFEVTAPGPFAIDQLVTYPNPTRGDAVWFMYNLQQAAEEIKLKIYDVSGDKIAEFDTLDLIALSNGKVKWDLTNTDGRRVSNGVYFYKFEATKAGKTLKARGKLAVLR